MGEVVLYGRAPAKINLALEVTGRRPDGYHELDTILQTLDLSDRVVLVVGGERHGIHVNGPYTEGTPEDETNLAWRAAHLLSEWMNRDDTIHVRLEKNIPPAGGLGGGASDAATVLRLLGRHWRAPGEAIFEVANAIGSDEAALLLGGTVRARGRGELAEPLEDLEPHDVVLFVTGETIERKTATLFGMLAGRSFDEAVVCESWARDQSTTIEAIDIYNTFERVAFDAFPGLARLWDELERATAEPIHLAGAGPTLFWIGPEGAGRGVATRASAARCQVILTSTAKSLWRP